MEEIRARVDKHIEVEEDQAERQPRAGGHIRPPLKGENKYPTKSKDYPLTLTSLREKRTQILCEIYHTNLLKYPKDTKGQRLGANAQEWCEFHRAYGHSTEDCCTLQEQIKKAGNLKALTSPRAPRRIEKGEAPTETRERSRREEKRRKRSRSPQRRDTRHRGVITTISRGGSGVGADRGRKRKASDVLVVREKVDTTPTLMIAFGERDMRSEPPRHDEPMVISVVVAKYKVERVLIDQGSSANILY
ncbi:hypothetical protein CR513_36493, partial [Mucuna pruriens]